MKPQDCTSHGRLSAAGLSYYAEDFSLFQSKADIIHRMKDAARGIKIFSGFLPLKLHYSLRFPPNTTPVPSS